MTIDKRYILVLDSSVDNDQVDIRIEDEQRQYKTRKIAVGSGDSQDLLGETLKVLDEINVSLHDIRGIAIIPGAKRFTIVRLVTVIGNAIAWSHGIPICSFSSLPSHDDLWRKMTSRGMTVSMIHAFAEPEYLKEPDIIV